MDNVGTPTQGRKDFFRLIKKVNDDKSPVVIKPTKNGEKGPLLLARMTGRLFKKRFSWSIKEKINKLKSKKTMKKMRN